MKILRSGLVLAAALFALSAQAQVKISDLPAGGALAGTEAVPAVQSANTVKTTPAALNTYVQAQTTSSTIIAKFSGTCDATTALTGNGSCQTMPVATNGTFNITLTTGYATTPTQTVTYSKVGRIVTVSFNGVGPLTSNSTALSTSAGAFGAGFAPASRTIVGPLGATGTNSGGTVLVCADLQTDGSLTWTIWSSTTGCGTGWTASGNKAVGSGATFTFNASS